MEELMEEYMAVYKQKVAEAAQNGNPQAETVTRLKELSDMVSKVQKDSRRCKN